MSKKNPMELVDRYLQAVRFWMPKTRQDDLIAELGEDLRSQIEERETELGRPIEESEVSEILKRCGAPMIVAGSLAPKRYLIGPTLYPIYKFVLKMVLLWILVPVFIFILIPVNIVNGGADWGLSVGSTLAQLWSGLFIAAGIITLVFAIVERTPAQAAVACKWDPSSLPPLRKRERQGSTVQTVCQLVFGFFGLIWLLLIPHYPVLILGPAAAFLKAAPIWHRFYVPILLLGVAGIVRSGITLARPQWGWFPPLGEMVQSALSLILLNFILDGWFPYVVLRAGAASSAQYVRVAAIVNVSILISLAASWLGLCIAMVVQLWRLMRSVREKGTGGGQPAAVQAR